tara:strand:- start:986 stop:1141 length:156 start_codon:yes stop_codon:yes gene_type:complete
MAYLMQQTDEFRDSYNDIYKRCDEIIDKLDVIEIRLKELEARVNTNRDDDD